MLIKVVAKFTKYGVLFYIKIRFCNLHFDFTRSCERCSSRIRFSAFTHPLEVVIDYNNRWSLTLNNFALVLLTLSTLEMSGLAPTTASWSSQGSLKYNNSEKVLFKGKKKDVEFNHLDASFCLGLHRGHDNWVSFAVVKQRHWSMQWMLHLKRLFLPYDNIQRLFISSVLGRFTMELLQHGRYNIIIWKLTSQLRH